MKKLVLCLLVCLGLGVHFSVYSNEPVSLAVSAERLSAYIDGIYHQIDFGKDSLNRQVFASAYKGFLNLKNAGKLSDDKDVLSICDFSRSANDFRLWVIDLRQKKVLFHTYVAHGQGSGEEFAFAFSNRENSHQSSLGFYVTGDTYDGEHGLSLRLNGMDEGFNSAAFDRGIVVHGAEYVSQKFIAGNDRLGRSWGCPAVPSNLSTPIINAIKEGTCLFIYYPQKKYLAASFWLNKKVEALPADGQFTTMPMADAKPVKRMEYISADSFARSAHYLIRLDPKVY